jgi:hypothetical protein
VLSKLIDKETFNKTLRDATKICEGSWLKIKDEEEKDPFRY